MSAKEDSLLVSAIMKIIFGLIALAFRLLIAPSIERIKAGTSTAGPEDELSFYCFYWISGVLRIALVTIGTLEIFKHLKSSKQ